MRIFLRYAVLGLALVMVALGVTVLGGRTIAPADRNAVAAGPGSAGSTATRTPDHVVVVMLENKQRASVIGSTKAPYLSSLAARGANMTQSYGVTHPSQPNYLALFSGSTQGATDDSCPQKPGRADNLGAQLVAAGRSFTGYSESLPYPGYTGCKSGKYQRKHNSWVNFASVPSAANQPFSAFPSDFARLPTVSFVSPNMCSDMHDCPVATGDAWLKTHLAAYAAWAMTHNSLLVVTFDENSGGTVNQIPTLVVGEAIRPGSYPEPMNHYTLLRTLEDLYGLPALGNAKRMTGLRSIWTTSPATAPASTGVVNGGFELGVAGWSASGTTTTVKSARHGGSAVARAGSTRATKGDSILSQTFTVPAGRTRLSVGYLSRCRDSKAKAWATIVVKRSSGEPLTLLPRTCRRRGGWRSAGIAVAAGQVYTVQLVSHDDGKRSTPNRTYYDDVTVR